jgi:hypothetical protein
MAVKVSNHVKLKSLLSKMLEEISSLDDYQSLAIRLEENGDYPYFVQIGFPDFFIAREDNLLATEENGKSVLEDCKCSRIIRGVFDPKFPFFTDKGSFWINSTTQFLTDLTEEEKQALGKQRKMCHHSGYESLLLIPIRAEEQTLGLLQIADSRENMFSPQKVERYELITEQIGDIILKVREISSNISKFNSQVT